ncbi:hypothetical protein AYO47_00110 [Planctomyces sp. SCGC AG-212-M04]|nr:hypothetical protein AYO47_00110 [Planctomyces sp. SCGC AG-212-M04]
MLHIRFVSAAVLAAVAFSAAVPAQAGGKWLREGNTTIIAGPTRNTKAVEIASDPNYPYPDLRSYGLIAFAPSGKAKTKLRLGKINNLSISYDVMDGETAGGSPRMSIIVDVNRDGEFDFADDEVVFVSLGNDPGGTNEAGDFVMTGNLLLDEGIFTTASGSVVLGDWEDVLNQTVNGLPISQGAVDYVFTIVDAATGPEELKVAVTAMQVNKDKLNARARIPSTN